MAIHWYWFFNTWNFLVRNISKGWRVEIHPGRLTAGTFHHGGLVQIIFLSKWVICRFKMLIFQGVYVF